jgi:undecaprenyl-diphosphatase
MPLLQVIVLAVVQGLTEFLPISSTAHLYLTSWLFGWQAESLQFDIMLHLGTFVAVMLYFVKDWLQIVAQAFGVHRFTHDRELKSNPAMLWLLALGSIPIGVFGLLLNKHAETTWRNPWLMGAMLIAIGLVMWYADHVARGARDIDSVGSSDAAIVGVAQALAIVPGCSRSGITISAGIFRGMTRESAARFSFLLSTPAVAAAAGKALYDVHKHGGGLQTLLTAQFALGVVVSALTGCLVIGWLLQYLRHSGLRLFVYYRIVFGIIVLALAFIRRPA